MECPTPAMPADPTSALPKPDYQLSCEVVFDLDGAQTSPRAIVYYPDPKFYDFPNSVQRVDINKRIIELTGHGTTRCCSEAVINGCL